MKLIKFFVVTLVTGLVLATLTPRVSAQCHSSPNFSTMDQDFLGYLKTLTLNKKSIAVLPFHDNHAGQPEPDFAYGIPFFIFDAYSGGQANIVHPYVTESIANHLGISGSMLNTKEAAQKVAKQLGIKHVIFGSSQLTFRGTIKLYLNIYDAKKDTVLSPAKSVETAYNDSSFDMIATLVESAAKDSKSGLKLRRIDKNTPGLVPFLSYSQGLRNAQVYEEGQLNVAEMWLTKGLKDSFHKDQNIALNLARIQLMKVLVRKLTKQDHTRFWQDAQATLRYITTEKTDRNPKYEVTYRFLKEQDIASQAATAYIAKNMTLANKLANSGLALVPEDGLLQNLVLKTQTDKKGKSNQITNAICF